MKVICFLLVFLFANELLSQDVFINLDSIRLYESDTRYKKAYDSRVKKYGFVNENGLLLIPFEYKSAKNFSNGLCVVSDGEGYGVIDSLNNIKIPFKYRLLFDFVNDRSVAVYNDCVGVIDVNDNIVIPFEYADMLSNNMRTFYYQHGEEKGLMNTKDSYPITFDYKGMQFLGDLFYVQTDSVNFLVDYSLKILVDSIERASFYDDYMNFKREGKTGVINSVGEIIIPCEYEEINQGKEGLWATRVGEKWGYLDSSNTFVIPAVYRKAKEFKNGKAIVIEGWDDCKIIDANGKELIDSSYEKISTIRLNDSKYLYKLTRNNSSILVNDDLSPFGDDRFQSVYMSFKDDLLMVQKEGLYGFLNTRGEMQIEPQFEYAKPFNRKRSIVGLEEKGVIDIYGNWILPPKYDKISSVFLHKFLMAERDSSFTIVDDEGDVFGPFYGVMQEVQDNYIIYRQGDAFILSRLNGEILFEGVFDKIKLAKYSNSILLEKNSKVGLYNFVKKNEILEVKYDKIETFYKTPAFVVSLDARNALIDIDRKVLVGFDMIKYRSMLSGFKLVKEDLIGFYNLDCHKLIPIIYDSFKVKSLEEFEVVQDGKTSVIDGSCN